MKLQLIFNGISKKMLADFELITSQFSHSLSKGLAREVVLTNFLKQYLPERFGVGTGLIISSVEGEFPSKEMDIVIYDKMNTPLLYDDHERQIFPVETVYAVIQVKSKLNSKELKSSRENILSAKSLTKRAFMDSSIHPVHEFYGEKYKNYFPMHGYLFAYSSVRLKGVKDKLIELDDVAQQDISKRIDFVTVLENGLIMNSFGDDENCKLDSSPTSDSKRRVVLSGENTLAIFYIYLMRDLIRAWSDPVMIHEYLRDLDIGELGR